MIRRFFPFTRISGSPLPWSVDYSTYDILYSVARRLNHTYTGSLIRIRRDSDNAEQDIGYDINNELDTAAIISFCTGTTGRIQKVYNQGTQGANFDQTFYTGTRSIIYQSGAVELVNGKPAMLGQTSNGYQTGSLAIANSIMIQGRFYSAVLRTQGTSSSGLICGEIGNSAGNNRKGLLSDTTTSRNLIDNIVTAFGGSQNHFLLVQATQNQQRQYSYWDCSDAALVAANQNSESFWNGNSQQLRGETVTWSGNTTFRVQIMRYSTLTFLGHFQEFSLKIQDSTSQTDLRSLEDEQNTFYSIY